METLSIFTSNCNNYIILAIVQFVINRIGDWFFLVETEREAVLCLINISIKLDSHLVIQYTIHLKTQSSVEIVQNFQMKNKSFSVLPQVKNFD